MFVVVCSWFAGIWCCVVLFVVVCLLCVVV